MRTNDNVQMDIFSSGNIEPFKFKKPIKVIELFAGYGSQMLAFEYLHANASHFRICEWAVPSIMAYNLIHVRDFTDYSRERKREWLTDYLAEKQISMDYNKPMTREQISRKGEKWIRNVYNNIIATRDTVDVTKTTGKDFCLDDRNKYDVFMSYSFPCQDLSLAGLGKGMEEDSGTRSSMIWQVGRILKEMEEMNQLPDVLMMENVPQVCGSKNNKAFNKWLVQLEELGYTSFSKIISATEFGIPQTRERCFVISILGNKSYEFPKGWKLDKCLKDMLENEVDEKYFLTEKQMRNITLWNNTSNRMENGVGKKVAKTLTTFAGRNDYNCNYVEIEKIGETKDKDKFSHRTDVIGSTGSVPTLTSTDYKHPILIGAYTPSGISGKIYSLESSNGTLKTGNHGNIDAVEVGGLKIREATKKGYAIANDGDGVYISHLKGKRGTVQKGMIQTIKTSPDIGVVIDERDNKGSDTGQSNGDKFCEPTVDN